MNSLPAPCSAVKWSIRWASKELATGVVDGVGLSLGAGERCHVLLETGGLGLVAAELVQDVLEGVEGLGAGVGEQLEGAVGDGDRVRVPGGGDRLVDAGLGQVAGGAGEVGPDVDVQHRRVALPGQGGGDRVRYRGGGPAGQAG
jgi:hypothetical protein